MTARLLRFDVASEDGTLRSELDEAVARVLDRGEYLHGTENGALESEVVEALGASTSRAGLTVGSGTDAITIALLALGIGPGDEVITVANAGLPGPTAIRRTGADVVFCDVDPRAAVMSPASAAALVGPKTRAILPVHLFGNVVDIDALRSAVPAVPIVEDCAQAFGSQLRGRAVGTLSELAAFSFYPTKNVGALGDGGFVTGHPELVARARRLARYGTDDDGLANELGTMSRLDELQAAALRVKLSHLGEMLDRRSRLLTLFDESLPEALSRVGRDSTGEPAIHLYVVRVAHRERLRAALETEGIETGVHYPVPAHHMPAFAGARRTSLSATEASCDAVLSLPFYPSMSTESVARVCGALEAASPALLSGGPPPR